MIGIQSMFSVLSQSIHIQHIFQVFVIPLFDLLDFVRCSETVKEVDERNFAFDSCQMSYRCQVHNFLNAGFAKHSTACLAACIYVGMITED